MDSNTAEDPMLSKLHLATTNLHTILQASVDMETDLGEMDKRFYTLMETLSTTSKTVAPLQSLAMSTKALDTRINRAVSPALKLLESFKLSESLQNRLLKLTSKLPTKKTPEERLPYLLKYVDCVDRLNSAINSIAEDCEPAIQRLQEVVEFLSRTKVADQYRTLRLRETLVTLKALYETEVNAMQYEGLLDQALLNLQDEYEGMLSRLRHVNMVEMKEKGLDLEVSDLGSDLEVEALRRISETLARNDCLDICIDIFVKVRYRRAAKALMRLNPDYLRTYSPEEIDEMEWETLETAITLWFQHFELAVKTVLVSEKNLCKQVLGGIMEGLIWAECFVKIADKIMAVFFRFGEGVARSSKEPQKLFKLLDMFDSMEKIKGDFSDIFEGEAGADICTRFRELEKLLVHASCMVFWEFGLQIEGNQDGLPPPQDGSVPKLVRYAVNYLKYLASDNYSLAMAKVLRTEQIWKAGFLSRPESDENLLKDAVTNIMEAIQRNIEAKKSRYRDKVLPHIFMMNTYWYIYMRIRNSELGEILGEKWLKKKYKTLAEESAYLYQKQAWAPLVRFLEKEEVNPQNRDAVVAMVRGNLDAFMKGIDDNLQRHRSCYIIADADLRQQIKEAIVKLIVPAYASFLHWHSSILQVKSFLAPDSICELLDQIFDGKGGGVEGKAQAAEEGKRKFRRREFKSQGSHELTVNGTLELNNE
ncbi:Exocyst complex protein Exo70 [Cinnamomum micranthum f. kanehirae]|uniref:Exocyst subunit Exo70 family protein n=1 Tax=Cinnamomum micranthum f. kanehirae TaxID=337451 RepID=A0A3S3PW07_9MAGN|nr:Exocyst complex protein Exo70 [Cinnamomum micranthum f. kanehirae]